jgi:hypothetical protein
MISIKITIFSPFVVKTPKKGKDSKKVQGPHELLIVIHLLIVVGGLLLIIIVVIVGSTSGTNAKSSQLSRSQRGIGVVNGRVDGHSREPKKWLIPRTMDNLLVAPNYLKALLHHIHALICVGAHSKHALEHLQEARVGARG